MHDKLATDAERAVLVLTVFAMLPALWRAAREQLLAHAAVLGASTAASFAYHMCQYERDVMHPECHQARVVDIGGAVLAVAAAAGLFFRFATRAAAARYAAALAAAVGAALAAFSVSVAVLAAAVPAAAALVAVGLRPGGPLGLYRGGVAAGGARVALRVFGAALSVFFVPAFRPRLYPYCHTFWHVGVGVACYYLIDAVSDEHSARCRARRRPKV